MKRASYKEAIAWIAVNDGSGDTEWLDLEHVRYMLTVALVADLFGKDSEDVAKAVIKYRKIHWEYDAIVERREL